MQIRPEHTLPSSRGFSVVALQAPKTHHNVGGALRACFAFDVSLAIIQGKRFMRSPVDVTKAYRSIPIITPDDDIFDYLPYDCIPIAIELIPGAKALHTFKHPERAAYIFGPEDSSLGEKITSRCVHKIYIASNHCLNLAACVNVVLYDRSAKLQKVLQ